MHDHGDRSGRDDRGTLAVVLGVTLAILLVEAVGAILTDSLALAVDCGHVAADALGLGGALGAAWLVRRPPTSRRSWGFARVEVLAATAQAAILLAASLLVVVGGIRRLLAPAPVDAAGLLGFAIAALVGNLVAAAVLASRRGANLSLRAAFLDTATDALGALGIVVAALVIQLTGWTRADPVVALAIGALIAPQAFRILRDAVDVLLEAAPHGLDLDAVREHLLAVEHVQQVHDLHISQIASGLPVLTAHVTVETGCFADGHTPGILDELQECVASHFAVSVEHSTFQLEPAGHRSHESTPHRSP